MNFIQSEMLHDLFPGIISVQNPSLLTQSTHFLLDISVDDGLYSTNGTVKVSVTPANNHAPVFDTSRYEAIVLENLPAGRVLIRVTATDKDFGVFGELSYFLPLQRSSKFFTVNRTTGTINFKLKKNSALRVCLITD